MGSRPTDYTYEENAELKSQLTKLAWIETLIDIEGRATRKLTERLLRKSVRKSILAYGKDDISVPEREGQMGSYQEPRPVGDNIAIPRAGENQNIGITGFRHQGAGLEHSRAAEGPGNQWFLDRPGIRAVQATEQRW